MINKRIDRHDEKEIFLSKHTWIIWHYVKLSGYISVPFGFAQESLAIFLHSSCDKLCLAHDGWIYFYTALIEGHGFVCTCCISDGKISSLFVVS